MATLSQGGIKKNHDRKQAARRLHIEIAGGQFAVVGGT
ncbi:hypothetical protein QE435_004984 [Rhizobium sp. SORGH_AS 787]|nr:hypothetical protein [Rhizobium sp. SORGH_AS_0787]